MQTSFQKESCRLEIARILWNTGCARLVALTEKERENENTAPTPGR